MPFDIILPLDIEFRVVTTRATYLCGHLVTEGVRLTAVTVMVTPIVSTPCPSAAHRSMGRNHGIWRNVPLLLLQPTVVGPTMKSKS